MLEHPLSPPRHHEYQSLRSSSTSPSSSQTLPFPEPSPSPGRPSSQSLPPSPPPSPPYPNNNNSTTNSIAEEADVDAMPPLPRVGYRSYLPKMPLPNRPSLSWRRGFRSSPTLAEAHRNASSPIELKSPGAEGGNGGAGGGEQKKRKRRGMRSRLKSAYDRTAKPIPIGLGALLIGVLTYSSGQWKNAKGLNADRADVGMDGDEMVVRVRGPWQVHVMGALPLRSLSRLWGYMNSFELPIWSREPGYKLYSWMFGCNLHEMDDPDLTHYVSLGDFFYRKLRPGVRPIEDVALVSPADGTLLHFGAISGARVEQVKGMSYSLDALLGKTGGSGSPQAEDVEFKTERSVDDREFANINDIDYSLGDLLGSGHKRVPSHAPENASEDELSSLGAYSGRSTPDSHRSFDSSSSSDSSSSPREDASVPKETTDALVHDASVALSMGTNAIPEGSGESGPRSSVSKLREGNGLFFTVVYLAPGDYHRFHSPTAWVVERRRHFAGELFSVSPYIAKRLSNLFVLNERVALLGRWRHGFFGMVPVGATNVGSIKVNFDQALRTNNRLRPHPAGTYIEAVYSKASALLKGQPLNPGEEMGGFMLGSTIVMIFEAPKDFKFAVKEGQKVKVGEAIGYVPADNYKPKSE